MAETKVLRATLGHPTADKGAIEISWGLNDKSLEFDRYQIDLQRLQACSKSVRDALEILPAALAENSGVAERLRAIADEGIGLYEAIMSGTARGGAAGSPTAAASFRKWFEDTVTTAPEGAWRIEIVLTDDSNTYPFGLAFTPAAEWPPAAGDIAYETYKNFWSCGLQLTSYSAIPIEIEPRDIESDNKTVSLLVEKDDGSFKKYVEEYAKPGKTENIMYRDAEAMEEAVYEKLSWHHIIYVLLKHDGSDIRVHQNIPRSVNRESLRFVVLDGDAVVRGDRGVGWPRVILSDAWSGVIAVETDIPNFKGGFWGWEFLKQTMTGEPLSKCLSDARKKTWPNCLLYGVYCDPNKWYVNPTPEDELQHLDTILTEVHRISRTQ